MQENLVLHHCCSCICRIAIHTWLPDSSGEFLLQLPTSDFILCIYYVTKTDSCNVFITIALSLYKGLVYVLWAVEIRLEFCNN